MPRAKRRQTELGKIGEAARAKAVRRAILAALKKHHGNIEHAAKALDVDRGNLFRYAEAAGIEDLSAAAATFRKPSA